MRPIFFRYIENSRECYNKSCWVQTYPPGDKSGKLYNIDSGKDQEPGRSCITWILHDASMCDELRMGG